MWNKLAIIICNVSILWYVSKWSNFSTQLFHFLFWLLDLQQICAQISTTYWRKECIQDWSVYVYSSESFQYKKHCMNLGKIWYKRKISGSQPKLYICGIKMTSTKICMVEATLMQLPNIITMATSSTHGKVK
jgi:hypothetical protein